MIWRDCLVSILLSRDSMFFIKNIGIIDRKNLSNNFDLYFFWSEEVNHYQIPKIFWLEKISRNVFNFTQKDINLGKPFFCIVKNGYVVWKYAYIFTKKLRLIQESLIYSLHKLKITPLILYIVAILFKPFKIRKSETIISLINEKNDNIFHWITERLTLLEAAEYYKRKTWNNFKILLSQDCCKFQKDTLSRMGYSENDFIYWQSGVMQVKNILIPSVRRYSESPWVFYDSLSHNACQWLKNRMPMNTCDSSKRIYISREKSQSRRVLNEGVLLSFLEKNWFKKYILEELDANQQIDLFNNAEYIIWPHWAWLTNMIWSKPATKVLEIMPNNRFRKDYFLLSCALWQDYALFIETSFNQKHDMYVDMDNFISFFNDFTL